MSREHMPTHAFISTHGLNTILPLDAQVEVKIGEQRATKFVRDLRPNDLVLGTSPNIRVSLAEVKQALLEEDLNYKHAFWKLHVPGIPQPRTRLQEYLEHVLQAPQASQDREEGESDPVTRISKLLERIDAKAGKWYGDKKTVKIERTRSAIASWLSGKTILPSNPLVLRSLRKLDRKKFDELFGPPQLLKPKPGDPLDKYPVLWAHERLWTDHKVLTKWFSGFSDEALTSEDQVFRVPDEEEFETAQHPKSRASRSLAQERRIIYDRLIKPIYDRVDGKTGFMRIKYIKACKPPEKSQPPSQPQGPVLSRGLIQSSKISGELRDKLPPATSFRDLHTEADYLARVLTGIFEDSGITLNKNPLTGGGVLNTIRHEPQTAATTVVLRNIGGEYVHEEFLEGERTRIFSEVMTRVKNGSFDETHKLPRGTTEKILERFHHLQKTIPLANERDAMKTSLFFAADLQNTPSRQRKETVKAINKIAHRLSQYGFQNRLLATDTHRSGGIDNIREALRKLGLDVDKLQLKEYADHELISVLAKLGICDFKARGKLIRLSSVKPLN